MVSAETKEFLITKQEGRKEGVGANRGQPTSLTLAKGEKKSKNEK